MPWCNKQSRVVVFFLLRSFYCASARCNSYGLDCPSVVCHTGIFLTKSGFRGTVVHRFLFSAMKRCLTNFKGVATRCLRMSPHISELKNRLPDNLYCVGGDVKPCSINQSINLCRLMPCAYCCCDRGWWLLSGCVWFVLWYVCLSVCFVLPWNWPVPASFSILLVPYNDCDLWSKLDWNIVEIKLSVHCSSYYGFLHVWYHYVTSGEGTWKTRGLLQALYTWIWRESGSRPQKNVEFRFGRDAISGCLGGLLLFYHFMAD